MSILMKQFHNGIEDSSKVAITYMIISKYWKYNGKSLFFLYSFKLKSWQNWNIFFTFTTVYIIVELKTYLD